VASGPVGVGPREPSPRPGTSPRFPADGPRARFARACRASWQLRRIARAEDARIAIQARPAADLYDLEQLRRAQSK
jgi:hypothetical protein